MYENELTGYLLRFHNIKKQLTKNFNKWEKQSRKSAMKVSSKLLEKRIRKTATNLNVKYNKGLKPDFETYWDSEVAEMKKLDLELNEEFEADLKLANIQASKFNRR